jgi:hypothetical protein
LAAEISDDNDGYPWLSWALTGVLTLAGVLIIGLAISAWKPRSQPLAAPSGTTAAVKSPVRPPPAAESRPASPAPAAGVSPIDAGASPPEAVRPAVPKGTSAPFAVAAREPPTPAEPHAAPKVSTPVSPPITPVSPAKMPVSPPTAPVTPTTTPRGNGPATAPPSAAVKLGPESVADKGVAAAQDAAKRTAFVRAVAEVRASMGQRNLAASKQNLQTAAANVQSPAEQDELERLQTLQDHLEQFWDGIRGAVAAMQPVDEIVLSNSNRVAVIEASRKELAVQREGRPQRWRIEAIPMDLLSAIAKTSFKPTAGSKLIVGSFLAMDGQGDRAEARKLWQEAIHGGEDEGKLLLPELNVPRAAGSGRRKH